MPGRTPEEREALARQNAAIMAVFERAGFDHIAPDIIQPADIFLDRSGEDIRARTFVFSDPDGNELCLRPDLTVPACRYHLSHAPTAEARYCYLGQAFRFPDEKLSPQEFTQAGIEWFGGTSAVAEEARILKLSISALEAAGLTRLKVTTGDLGLFNALLDGISMPDRWRRKLRHQFWRPEAFRTLINQYSSGNGTARTSISATIDQLATMDPQTAVNTTLYDNAIPHVGDRSVADIAGRLSEKFQDRSEKPLGKDMAAAIAGFLAIEGTMPDVLRQFQTISGDAAFVEAVANFERRIEALEDLGLNPRRFHFDANFGRDLEYYTGFVFQIESNAGNHTVAVAGGGRYDDLLGDLGAPRKTPAVGCAIHTERVKAALA